VSNLSPQEPVNEKPGNKKPTVWIVLAGVLALVAIGLGIWVFSVNSDLDDTQATVDQQNEQLAAAEEKGTEAVAGAKNAYDDVSTELESTQQQNDDLEQDLETSASELDDATDAAADAQGEKEKADAQLKEAEASADTAKSCARAAIEAFGQVFEAPSLEEGIDAAVAEFQKLKPSCRGVLGE
jgi:predicted  nucleic acid-binding Zn-ribbon protein